MIVTLANIRLFLDIDETDNSQDHVISPIHNGVEKQVKKYLDWEPEEVVHVNKLYDGTGSTSLYLDEMYISALKQVATSKANAIKIRNTATDATNAYVTVDGTNVSLTVLGGTSEDSTDLAIATYTTMTLMVAAINAVGKGWEAEIEDSDYNSIESTEILEVYNLYCGSRGNSTATWDYLMMPYEPVNVRLYPNRGELYCASGFPYGHQNIAVSYTSGYASGSMNDDIEFAVMIGTKYWYDRWQQESFGLNQFSLGHVRVSYDDVTEGLPLTSLQLLDSHRRLDGQL